MSAGASQDKLFGNPLFENKTVKANHIGIRPFGSFNYIYLNFIPH